MNNFTYKFNKKLKQIKNNVTISTNNYQLICL